MRKMSLFKILIVNILLLVFSNQSISQVVDKNKVSLLNKKIESLISKSKYNCLKEYENIIHVFWGELKERPDSTFVIVPVLFEERCLFKKKSYLRAESYVLFNNQIVGISDGKQLYRNCGYVNNNPYADSEILIDFISDKNLDLIFQLTEIRLGLYYGVDKESNEMFFEMQDRGYKIIPKEKL